MLQREVTFASQAPLARVRELEAVLGGAIQGKPEVVRLALA